MANTYNEAYQAKLSLKMLLSNHAFFKGVDIIPDGEGYSVVVLADEITNAVKKVVPVVCSGVEVNCAAAK